jgi:hypothetical protein
MPDRKKLLQDFYAKYAPDQELSDERLSAIDKKYGNNNEQLLRDFYAKYAPDQEVTPERIDAINKKYQLNTTPPTEPPIQKTGTYEPRNKVAEMLNQPTSQDIQREKRGIGTQKEVVSGTKAPEIKVKTEDVEKFIENKATESAYIGTKQEAEGKGLKNTLDLFPEKSDNIANYLNEESKVEYNFLKALENYGREVNELTARTGATGNPQTQADLQKAKFNKYKTQVELEKFTKQRNAKIDEAITLNENLINYLTAQGDSEEKIADAQKEIVRLQSQKENYLQNPDQKIMSVFSANKQEMDEFKVPGNTPRERVKNYALIVNRQIEEIDEKIKTKFPGEPLEKPSWTGGYKMATRSPELEVLWERKMKLTPKMQALAQVALVDRMPTKTTGGFIGSMFDAISKELLPDKMTQTNLKDLSIQDVGKIIEKNQIAMGLTDEMVKESAVKQTKELQTPTEFFSAEGMGNLFGTSLSMIPAFTLGNKATAAMKIPQMIRMARMASTTTKYGKYLVPTLKASQQGIEYAMAKPFLQQEELKDEANFLSGFLGAVLSKPVEKALSAKNIQSMIGSLFGEKAPIVVNQLTVLGNKVANGFGEYGSEVGETVGSIAQTYLETKNFAELKKSLNEQFGSLEPNMELFVGSVVMGFFMGSGTGIGDAAINKSKEVYAAMTPEQKKTADEILKQFKDDLEVSEVNAKRQEIAEGDAPPKVEEVTEVDLQNKQAAIEVIQSPTTSIKEKAEAAKIVRDIEAKEREVKITEKALEQGPLAEGEVVKEEVVETPKEEVVKETPMAEETKVGELVVTDEVKDIKDEVTDEKIGEKKYQSFSIDFEDGARAIGTIENGVASISGINAPKAEGSAIEPKRGTKTYERVISKLKESGVKTISVKLQSTDSEKAIDKLVEKGILTNPRDIRGGSFNQRPTTFDISEQPTTPKEVTPITPKAGSVGVGGDVTEAEKMQFGAGYKDYNFKKENVPISKIRITEQPSLSERKDLVEDIKKNGIKEPIVVEYDKESDTYYVKNGNNRAAIAKELGITEVPTIIAEYKKQSLKETPKEVTPTTPILKEEGKIEDKIEEAPKEVVEAKVEGVKIAKTNNINGYEFTDTPSLKDVIVKTVPKENLVTVESDIFLTENKNSLAEGVKNEGGGWYSMKQNAGAEVFLYNDITKEGVVLTEKKGGTMGVVVQDFIKNNSREAATTTQNKPSQTPLSEQKGQNKVETPKKESLKEQKPKAKAEIKAEKEAEIKDRLLDRLAAYNSLSTYQQNTQKNRDEIVDIFGVASKYKFTIADANVKSTKQSKKYELFKDGKKQTRTKVATETTKATPEQVKVAERLIDKDMVTMWDGSPYTPHLDAVSYGITWQQIRKGEQDIKNGKVDSVPARKLIEVLNQIEADGMVNLVSGSGSMMQRDGYKLSEARQANREIPELTDEDIAEINANEDALAKEYDEWFESLSEEEQINILEENENRNQNEIEQSPESREGKKDVSNEKDGTRESLQEKVAEAEKDLKSAQNKLSKARQSQDEIGKEQQVNIFGNKPADNKLFGADVSIAEKQIKKLQDEVDAAKENLDKAKAELDNVVPANQMQMGLEGESETADPLKNVENTAKALEGIDNFKERFLEFFAPIVNNIKKELPKFAGKDKSAKIVVINKGGFIGDPITFYRNGKLYKGQTKEVKQTIKSRADGKPTQQEINEALSKIDDKNLFNVVVSNEFGDVVLRGDLVVSPKEVSIEDAQAELDILNESKAFASEKILNTPQGISEAYHKAKADGSNPKLVQAVEDAVSQSTEQALKDTIAKELNKSANELGSFNIGSTKLWLSMAKLMGLYSKKGVTKFGDFIKATGYKATSALKSLWDAIRNRKQTTISKSVKNAKLRTLNARVLFYEALIGVDPLADGQTQLDDIKNTIATYKTLAIHANKNEVQDVINAVDALSDLYIELSADLNTVKDKIASQAANGQQAIELKEDLTTVGKLIESFADDFKWQEKVQNEIEKVKGTLPDDMNPYMQKDISIGRVENTISEMMQKIFGKRYGQLKTNKKGEKSLFERAAQDKISQEDLDFFMYVQHAKERNARVEAAKIIEKTQAIQEAQDRLADLVTQDQTNPSVKAQTTMAKQALSEAQSMAIVTDGSGMSNEEADRFMQEFEKSGKVPKLEEYAKEYRETVIKPMIDMMEEGNLLDADQAEMLRTGMDKKTGVKFDYYVPLKVEKEALEQSQGTVASASPTLLNPIKSIKGTSKYDYVKRISPIAQSISDFQAAAKSVEDNKTAQSLYKLVKENPNKDIWEIVSPTFMPNADGIPINQTAQDVKDSSIPVKIDGKLKYIKLNHKGLREAWMRKQSNPEYIWRLLLNVFRTYNNFKRKVLTQFSPEFALVNLIRDVQDAVFNSSGVDIPFLGKQIIGNLPKANATAAKAIYGNLDPDSDMGKTLDLYLASGGKISWANYNAIEDVQKEIDQMTAKFSDDKSLGYYGKNVFNKVVATIGSFNETVETGTRLATFKALIDNGITPEKAASISKNMTVNFNKRGTATPLLNAAYLFSNAGIQSIYVGAKGLVKSKKTQRYAAYMMLTGAAIPFIQQMMIAAVSESDEEEKEYKQLLTDEDNTNFIVIPTGKKQFLRISKSYGMIKVFLNSGQELGSAMIDGKISEHSANIVSTILSVIDPIAGSSQNTLSAVAPTTLRPFVEVLMLNRNYQNAPIYPEDRFGPESADYLKFYPKTADFYKNFAENMYFKSGSNIDVSPETLEYIVNDFFSGIFRTGENFIVAGSQLAQGKEVDPNKIPFKSKFIVDMSEQDWRYTKDFWTIYNNSEKVLYQKEEIEEVIKLVMKLDAKRIKENGPEAVKDMQKKVDLIYEGQEKLKERKEAFEKKQQN